MTLRPHIHRLARWVAGMTQSDEELMDEVRQGPRSWDAPITIVESPRPEPGQEPPLPSYHDMLGEFCDRFHVLGDVVYTGEDMRKQGHAGRAIERADLLSYLRTEADSWRGDVPRDASIKGHHLPLKHVYRWLDAIERGEHLRREEW